MNLLFASDVHGSEKRYKKLFKVIEGKSPDAVLLGGDLLPHALKEYSMQEYIQTHIFEKIRAAKKITKTEFFIIFGNDDPRIFEKMFIEESERGLIHYIHKKSVKLHDFFITGYSYVPPTPFQLKDWERYDVSRFVDVGAIPPESGIHTIDPPEEISYHTIKDDLEELAKKSDPQKTIFLFHAPPYKTFLDRAALDGHFVDHAPVDVHIGSIAILRFIEKYQPFITLHGHVHESTQLTGFWQQKIGNTFCMNAAHDGAELSVITIDTKNPKTARREIFSVD